MDKTLVPNVSIIQRFHYNSLTFIRCDVILTKIAGVTSQNLLVTAIVPLVLCVATKFEIYVATDEFVGKGGGAVYHAVTATGV